MAEQIPTANLGNSANRVGMHRLRAHELGPAQIAPLPLYFADQRCLCPQGSLTPVAAQWQQCLQEGVYVERASLAAQTPRNARQMVRHAVYCLQQLQQKRQQDGLLASHLMHIARLIHSAWAQSPDCVLASLLLQSEPMDVVSYAVHSACIAESVLCSMGQQEAAHWPVLCACLSAAWPQHDAEALQQRGVSDPYWLEIVRRRSKVLSTQYRRQASDDLVDMACQLVVLAELFCQRIEAHLSTECGDSRSILRDLLIERGGHFDGLLASYFIRALGVYPTGSVVLLVSGEIGVVCDQSDKLDAPWVAVLMGPLGQATSAPVLRDSSAALYRIRTTLIPQDLPEEVDMEAIWGRQGRDYELPSGASTPLSQRDAAVG